MSVEFSEYRSKRSYKSRRRKIPIGRLILLAVALFCCYKAGLVSKIIDALPLPGSSEDDSGEVWRSQCQMAMGRPFELNENLVQCSWVLRDSMPQLPNSFLRYVASTRKSSVSKLHWVAPRTDFSNAILVQIEDSTVSNFLHMRLADSTMIWVNESNGCRYPGLCPQQPLGWSSLSISEDFDFDGQEALLSKDVLKGLGEAPIHPVLPGYVLDVGKDSLGFFVEINHGNNVTSKMSGMRNYERDSISLKPGDFVNQRSLVGRLAPKDSSSIYLSINRNGSFVRWNDFYHFAHPVDSVKIAKFKTKITL